MSMAMTDKEFFEELESHPELKNRFKEVLSIAANKGENLVTLADAAELEVISQMRKLGNETLQEWATTEAVRVALSVKEQLPSAKKHIKKNSGGTPSTEK